jgi:hypothetical protein
MISPQEKAEKLYRKYIDALNIRDLRTTANPFAKQCALIAVDEIIKSEPRSPSDVDWDDCGATHQYYYEAQREEADKYWQEVKNHIQEL